MIKKALTTVVSAFFSFQHFHDYFVMVTCLTAQLVYLPDNRLATSQCQIAHYFLRCSRYNVLRLAMVLNLNTLNTLATLPNLLYGNANLSSDHNFLIFNLVYTFIMQSKRFKNVL